MLGALAALALLAQAADELHFAPEPGRNRTKTLVHTTSRVFDEWHYVVDGVAQEITAPGTATGEEKRVRVTDELTALADGRLAGLRRTFDEVRMTSTIGDQETPYESELEGLTVEFSRAADSEEWSASLGSDEEATTGRRELLDGLSGPLELEGLLPRSAVKRGDEWELEPERFFELLSPFGELALKIVQTDSGWHAVEYGDAVPGPPEYSGTFRATYAGRRKVDGVMLARVELAFDVQYLRDMTAMERVAHDMFSRAQGRDSTLDSAGSTSDYSGKGLLTWDLKRGEARELTLELHSTLASSSESTLRKDGKSHAVEEKRVFHGEGALRLTFE
jgi:hypothetical protein